MPLGSIKVAANASSRAVMRLSTVKARSAKLGGSASATPTHMIPVPGHGEGAEVPQDGVPETRATVFLGPHRSQ